MLVELDVFSGRPNPRWQLDEPDRRALQRLHGQLAAAAVSPPQPPALGYRGFCYSLESGTYRAFRGYVWGGGVVLADPRFTIERFLLDRVPPEMAPLRKRVGSELGHLE